MLGFWRIVSVAAAVAVALVAGGCKKQAPSPEGQAEAAQAVQEATFRVDGMTCASCNVTVKVAAEKVRGVRSARADSEQGRAWVTFDPSIVSADRIAAAISETGYTATLLPPTGAPASSAAPNREDGSR